MCTILYIWGFGWGWRFEDTRSAQDVHYMVLATPLEVQEGRPGCMEASGSRFKVTLHSALEGPIWVHMDMGRIWAHMEIQEGRPGWM